MYDDIEELLKKYNENKLCADENFINTICEIVRDYRKIDRFINNWYFDTSLKAFGKYNPSDFSIQFNLQYNGYLRAKEINPNYQYLFYNIEVLMGIFHEFVHVDQLKKLYELFEEKKLPQELFDDVKLLEASILFLSMNDYERFDNSLISKLVKRIQFSYYFHNHDNDPTEREADIKSLKDTKSIIDKMASDEETKLINEYLHLIKYIDYLCGYKLKGDTTNNICLDYFKYRPFAKNKDYLKKALPLFKNLNLPFDIRILYGLPLTKDEYISLNMGCLEAGKAFKKSILNVK